MSEHVKISVVTPSFNQGKFIEENIQSVLAQNYPNFEHIIVDGGSTDETIEILKKYPHLKWVSEPDRGQSHALNKGFEMAKGEVIGWLNSDDLYLPGTFKLVASALDRLERRWVVMGDVEIIDESGKSVRILRNRPKKLHQLLRFWDPDLGSFHQPGIFFFKEILDEVGLLDESLCYAMDYDLWLRVIQKYDFHRIEAIFAKYRFHGSSKSGSGWDPFIREWEQVSRRYLGRLSLGGKILYSLSCSAYMGWYYARQGKQILRSGDYERAREYFRLAFRYRPLYPKNLRRWVLSYLPGFREFYISQKRRASRSPHS